MISKALICSCDVIIYSYMLPNHPPVWTSHMVSYYQFNYQRSTFIAVCHLWRQRWHHGDSCFTLFLKERKKTPIHRMSFMSLMFAHMFISVLYALLCHISSRVTSNINVFSVLRHKLTSWAVLYISSLYSQPNGHPRMVTFVSAEKFW